jgi:two-component system phosphate regulon response regulator PhoB
MPRSKPLSDAPAVLLAEDDDSFRVFCRLAFERAGYRVVEAIDGTEAIQKALDARPKALILDLWLPGITGREVLRILRQNRDFEPVPILVVSGVPEVRDREGLLADGADEVIEKPVAPTDLVRTLALRLQEGRRAPAPGGRRLEGADG